MTPVFSVSDVHFHMNKMDPTQLVVHASGLASTSGWSGGKLVARVYVRPPEDGVQDFDFVATPPTGFALQVLSPIAGEGTVELADWMKGVRVAAKTNEMAVFLTSNERSVDAA